MLGGKFSNFLSNRNQAKLIKVSLVSEVMCCHRVQPCVWNYSPLSQTLSVKLYILLQKLRLRRNTWSSILGGGYFILNLLTQFYDYYFWTQRKYCRSTYFNMQVQDISTLNKIKQCHQVKLLVFKFLIIFKKTESIRLHLNSYIQLKTCFPGLQSCRF